MTNLDPLASPTVQAAIIQAERMAHLETGLVGAVAETDRLREEVRDKLDKILEQTTKTNGSVAAVIREQEQVKRDLTSVQEGVGQAKSLAADASGEVQALGAEVDAIKSSRHDGDLVSKTRGEVLRAQLKLIGIGYGAASSTLAIVAGVAKLLGKI